MFSSVDAYPVQPIKPSFPLNLLPDFAGRRPYVYVVHVALMERGTSGQGQNSRGLTWFVFVASASVCPNLQIYRTGAGSSLLISFPLLPALFQSSALFRA